MCYQFSNTLNTMTNYFLGENWGVQINIYKKQTYYLFTYSVLLSDSRMNPQNYIQPFNKDYLDYIPFTMKG